ncbi:winged helix-turn-helix domain-containing protein [Rhodococcus sp. 06-156-3C]|uniref:winged helix-turn-helix domain-containing protein n=1 Tax=Rhodococcus sp. 06-156-3C TaxID=2022486 RepID=UPI003F902C5D
MMTVDSQLIDQLTRIGACDRLAERERLRGIVDAKLQGLTHRQISRYLGGNLSQASVTRLLQRVGNDFAAVKRVTPAEIIDQHAAGQITGHEMMRRLFTFDYSVGTHPTVNGHETDAYVPGDFDDVEQAFYRGLLTPQQFQVLADRQVEVSAKQSNP